MFLVAGDTPTEPSGNRTYSLRWDSKRSKLPAYMPTSCLPCLPSCLPAQLPACLHAICLPARLCVYVAHQNTRGRSAFGQTKSKEWAMEGGRLRLGQTGALFARNTAFKGPALFSASFLSVCSLLSLSLPLRILFPVYPNSLTCMSRASFLQTRRVCLSA